MYLPAAITIVVPTGAFLGYFYNRWAARQSSPDFAKRMGTLLATGLIVGESLFGVVNAGLIAASAGDSPLEIFSGGKAANIIGVLLFIGAIAAAYKWTAKKAS